ncbi:unnamed protein product [Lymnaea stagnalis]|uniref:Testis-expressed protein 26 n=1 Tax=Lymnaea stagnalis TaxID=6523 RepID=A0AAV2I9P6_LYMST
MATSIRDSGRLSYDRSKPQGTMDVINTETRLGDDVLSPVFLKELEHYYDKADVKDKAKCLELITSVSLGEELRQQVKGTRRPKTSMPAFGHRSEPLMGPYHTTYERDYPPKTDDGIWAIRPMTSQGYATTVPKSQPPGPTTYDVEFCNKYQRPASPERAGTASGNRNNRPHPPQSFMVWRFPRKNKYNLDPLERPSEELTNEKLNQITKRLCHSVYQNDYLGIPQGFQVKSAFNLPPDWKDSVPYGMESNQRQSYQLPFQQRELLLPTSRYGSNDKKDISAVAAIPTANKRIIGLNGRTTYDRHYNDNAGPVIEQIREVGKKLGVEALKKHYERSTGQDRELIGKLLKEYSALPSPVPPTYSRPVCPTPHINQRTHSVSNRTPSPPQRASPATPSPTQVRFNLTSPAANGFSSRPSSQKLHPTVPPATPILMPLPTPYNLQMPTSPLSLPYTPPMYLS